MCVFVLGCEYGIGCVLVLEYGVWVWNCVYWYRDMGLELFGSHIITPVRVQSRVVKGILSLISKERQVNISSKPVSPTDVCVGVERVWIVRC